MPTLINELTTYFQTQLNAINENVTFDLGYLFARDGDTFVTIANNQQTLRQDKTKYVPSMLTFKGDFNKPLNYSVSNQLAKSGTIVLYFSLPDKNVIHGDGINEFDTITKALEDFENKFTGYRENSTPLILTSNGLSYQMLINSSPIVDNGGIIKFGSEWRTLVTLSLSIKLGHNIAYAENIKTEIKRYSEDDSKYVELELSNISGGIASAITSSQEDGENIAKAGIQNTAVNKSFQVYYPYGNAYSADVNAKSLMLEFFRRVVDKDYNPDKRYVIRETYPDFTAINTYKYIGGVPTQTKGVELSAGITLAPYRNG